MIIREVSYARAGLVGNPSDIFHGKTISLLFDRFSASVKLYETPCLTIVPNARDMTQFKSLADLVAYKRQFGYYGGVRIIEAIIVRFARYCEEQGVRLDERNFTVEYDSTIPFAVGLGGSAAIIRAVLGALMRFYDLTDKDIPRAQQANIMLEAETKELEIGAGPQDRVVMVYGGVVYMDFTEQAYKANQGLHGKYENLDPEMLPPLFIAYSEKLSKSSGRVHNLVRYRVDVDHDDRIMAVMRDKAQLVDELRALLQAGRKDEIGPLLTRDFELRKSVYDISVENQRLVDVARHCGTHANYAGSGGAVIGIYTSDEQYAALEEAYRVAGFAIFKVRPVEYCALSR